MTAAIITAPHYQYRNFVQVVERKTREVVESYEYRDIWAAEVAKREFDEALAGSDRFARTVQLRDHQEAA